MTQETLPAYGLWSVVALNAAVFLIFAYSFEGRRDAGGGLSRTSSARSLGAYAGASAAAHLLWEFGQMPFYTLWQTGSAASIAFAAAHCTVGDVLIASIALGTAMAIFRAWRWPLHRFGEVAAATVVFGLGYAIFSEWLNVEVRGSWAYADSMPVVPVIGTGVLPLLQWSLIPPLALMLARRMSGD